MSLVLRAQRRLDLVAAASLVVLGAALGAATPTSAAPGAAPVQVEHSERTLGTVVEPLALISVAFLSGDRLQVPDLLRPGSVDPSWMLAWKRQLTIAWQIPAQSRLASHPLSHIAPSILSLDDGPAAVATTRKWTSLDCAHDDIRELDSQVLAKTLDGTFLVGVDLRCRSGKRGANDSQWRRLLVRTNALGQAQVIVGLETTRRAPQWPAKPATIRNQPVRAQAVEGGFVVSVEIDVAPVANTGLLDHGPLPQPERWQPAVETAANPRIVLAFDAHGAPTQLLARGAMAATPAEATAAVARRPLERALAAPGTLAPPALDDALASPLWLGDEAGTVLLLELGQRTADGTVHDAALAGWRWKAGAWQRLDITLPRTAAEGRWSCGADAALGSLHCTFERPPLPTARGFGPQRLNLGPAERDRTTAKPAR